MVPLILYPTCSYSNIFVEQLFSVVSFGGNNVLQFITTRLSRQVSHRLYFDSSQRMPSLMLLGLRLFRTIGPMLAIPPPFSYMRGLENYPQEGYWRVRGCYLPVDVGSDVIQPNLLIISSMIVRHSMTFDDPLLADVHHKSIALLHEVTPRIRAQVLNVIPSLLSPPSPLQWSHGSNTWFLGHIPFILIHHFFPLLSPHVISALSHLWDILFIHLAARIWGCIQRLSESY